MTFRLKKCIAVLLLSSLALLSKGQSPIASIKTKSLEVTQKIKLKSITIDSIGVDGSASLSDNKKLLSKLAIDNLLLLKKANSDSSLASNSAYLTVFQNKYNVKYKDTLNRYTGATSNTATLSISVYLGAALYDGVLAEYNGVVPFCNCVDIADALKIGFGQFNLTLVRDGTNIAVERRSGTPNKIDTLHLKWSSSNPGTNNWNFKININNTSFVWTAGSRAILRDYYLSTDTDITAALYSTTPVQYNFSTTSGVTASYGARFDILIIPAAPLVSTPFYTNNNLNIQDYIRINDNAGTSGQVLTTQGPNLPPLWTTPGAVTSVTSSGDIEVTDFTKGVILKSPDGTRWRLTINNDGSFTTTSL